MVEEVVCICERTCRFRWCISMSVCMGMGMTLSKNIEVLLQGKNAYSKRMYVFMKEFAAIHSLRV